MTLLFIPGNNAFYNWTFEDVSPHNILNSRQQSVTYTFNTLGTYTVNASVFNAVSDKSNTTEVFVQEEVAGLQVTTTVTGEA